MSLKHHSTGYGAIFHGWIFQSSAEVAALVCTMAQACLQAALIALFLVLTSTHAKAEAPSQTQTAIFAGGCFWCTEADFEKVKGVISAESGYIGGNKKNPNYRQVSSGGTKHTEAVRIAFDPSVVSYETLLTVFWHSIDPLAKDRQFCDKGRQYRSGIFYLNETQQTLAEASKAKAKTLLDNSGKHRGPIHTEITQASTFWLAEEYHQDYYKKNPVRYQWYRTRCGRDDRLKSLWGDLAGWKPEK